MSEAEIKTDEGWKAEVADEKGSLAEAEEKEQVWITYAEVKNYLTHVATSLLGLVNHIENSIKSMEENITKGEIEDEHDDED